MKLQRSYTHAEPDLRFEWGSRKASDNERKHGVSFDEANIMAVRLDTGETEMLVERASYPLYVPGYLLYTRGGTLLAQRFDATSLEVSGEEFVVVDGVRTNPHNGMAEVAVALNGSLAYVPGGPTMQGRRLSWVNRSGAI